MHLSHEKNFQFSAWFTEYFNFKYLPLKQAIFLPVVIARKVKFRKLGGSIKISDPIRFGMIKLGFSVVGSFDESNSICIWEVRGQVNFLGNADLGIGTKLIVGKNGVLSFGENFKITAESSIWCYKMIKFGKNCLISWDVLIMDTDSHIIRNLVGEIINSDKEILVGNKVWIGSRATLLKGTRIEDENVIAAGAVVSGEFSGLNQIIVGNPAKIIKTGITWDSFLKSNK